MEERQSYETNAQLEKFWYASQDMDIKAYKELTKYYLLKLVPIAYKYLIDKEKAIKLCQKIIHDELFSSSREEKNIGARLMRAVRIACQNEKPKANTKAYHK